MVFGDLLVGVFELFQEDVEHGLGVFGDGVFEALGFVLVDEFGVEGVHADGQFAEAGVDAEGVEPDGDEVEEVLGVDDAEAVGHIFHDGDELVDVGSSGDSALVVVG